MTNEVEKEVAPKKVAAEYGVVIAPKRGGYVLKTIKVVNGKVTVLQENSPDMLAIVLAKAQGSLKRQLIK